MGRFSFGKYWQLLLGIIVASTLFRAVLAQFMPLGFDEAYYYFYGKYPALSYFDHPLGVSIYARIGEWLGSSLLSFRLPSIFSFSLAILLIAEATRQWFGKRAAIATAVLTTVSPLLMTCGGLLMLPDSGLILSASILIYWLSHYPLTPQRSAGYYVLTGLMLGLMTLAKYQSFLIIFALLIWLARSRQSRRIFAQWRFYCSLPALLLVSSPIWIWNINNQWASFAFHSSRTNVDMAFRPMGSLLFVLAQIGVLFPTVGILLLISLIRLPEENQLREPGRLLLTLAIPQFVVFTVLAGKMQVMISWLVLGWWLLLPLAGFWLTRPKVLSKLWLRLIVVATIVTTPTLMLAAVSHLASGTLDRFIPATIDTSKELITPTVLVQSLKNNPKLWQAIQNSEVIASYRYELPGFLAFALANQNKNQIFTAIANDPRGFKFWSHCNDLVGRKGVAFGIKEKDKRLIDREWSQNIGPIKNLGEVNLYRGGKLATTLEFVQFGPIPAQ